MKDKIKNLLIQAKTCPKHDWQTYEFFKTQIARWCKDDKEYQDGIRELVNILEV